MYPGPQAKWPAEVATRTTRQTGVRSANRLWNSRAKDSNLRPVDTEEARPRAREQKTQRLASRKSRRKHRNGPESHPTDRTHTVPGAGERDA